MRYHHSLIRLMRPLTATLSSLCGRKPLKQNWTKTKEKQNSNIPALACPKQMTSGQSAPNLQFQSEMARKNPVFAQWGGQYPQYGRNWWYLTDYREKYGLSCPINSYFFPIIIGSISPTAQSRTGRTTQGVRLQMHEDRKEIETRRINLKVYLKNKTHTYT